jgi:PAS domain S-box-containing protein
MYSVLYVDDDPNLLDIARYFLEDSGDFAVATSLLATEALDLPDFTSFDAIISDYEMPRMNGITFLKKVRETHGDIPFILFTGKGREEVVIDAINHGADFYLQKGGDPTSQFAELAHKIKNAVERRRAERALKEREQTLRVNDRRLRMAQRIGHTGSWEFDLATNRIWGSAEGLRIFGYPGVAGDFPLEDIEACIPERKRVHQALDDLVMKGTEYDTEYLINPADGSPPRMIHSIARLEKDADGTITRVAGVIHDITERKRREEEITFKNAILQTQQETTLDGILVVDEKGKILSFNQKFVGIWGIPGEILQRREDEPVLQHVMGQIADPAAFLSRVRYLYDHKDEKSSEEILLNDGRILERYSAPMFGDTGKYYGRVWYFRDITARRRAVENLKESEARFHSLYTHMIEGVALHELTFDVSGTPQDYRILEVNPAFERHLGISRDMVIGKTSREAYGVDDPPYFDIYKRVALTGEAEFFETYFPPLRKNFSIAVYSPARGSFATVFEDITERRRSEHELRESEEKYRLLVEQTQDIIYSITLQGVISHVSPHIARYGYIPEQLLSRNISEFIVEEDLMMVQDAIRATVASGTANQTRFRIRDATGNQVWFEDNGAVLRDATGTTVGIAGVLRDITGRKNAEDALRESEEKYRSVVENIQDIYYRSDRDGNLILISPSGLLLLGFDSAEEMLGKPIMESFYYRPEERNAFLALLEKSGSVKDYELRLRKKDGSPITVSTTSHYYYDPGGRIAGIEGIFRDITDRKSAEDQLRESEEKYRLLVENSPDAMYIYRGDRFVFTNRRVTEVTGFSPDELLQMRIWDLVHPDDRPDLMEYARRRFAGLPAPPAYSARIITRDGTLLPMEFAMDGVMIRGEFAVLGVARVILDRN